jgi:signal transduction histidine kinase
MTPMKDLVAGAVTRAASSLTNRIFLASTLLATLSLGLAFYFVNMRATADAEEELRRGLLDAAALADQQRAALTDTYTRLARLVADLPKLKAAVATGHPPTIEPIALEYLREIGADLLVLTDARGTLLASAGPDATAGRFVREDLPPLEDVSTYAAHPLGLLQVVSVPIVLVVDPGFPPDTMGRLTFGFLIDDEMATRFKGVTGSEMVFGAGGRILASSLPAEARPALERIVPGAQVSTVTIGDEQFLAVARAMPVADAGGAAASPLRIILRSRTERLRFLNALRFGLAGALVVTLLMATILSYGVARSMTRPLAAVTNAMRDVAATGDLSRRVAVRSGAWDDEDARLLAAAFNTLTESIARFQRESAQKERLSALGRLSTVVAHEVRNPLMIIRTSLRALRRDDIGAAELREAVADIDEEVQRLNRVVTEVLDFARPIRFELAEASVNEVCRASAAAAWAGDGEEQIHLDLDPALPLAVTDAERLRTALVNILTNARHAVEAADRSNNGPGVVLTTRRRGTDRLTIVVRDRGVGIAAEHMPHIFDPYFTTRRAGTGLGLPISKNIIEGLGGTLSIASRSGEGTEIRIDLPLATAGVAA